MTTPAPAPPACFRCGGFLSPADRPISDLDLCRRCLTEPPKGDRTPLRETWVAHTGGSGAIFGVFLTACLASFRWGGAALVIPALLVCISLSFWLTYRSSKQLIERLDLGRAPDPGRFVHALFTTRPERLFGFSRPLEEGFLVEGEGGVAFLGERGTRLLLGPAELARASVEHVRMGGEKRWAVRVERGAAGPSFIALEDDKGRAEQAVARWTLLAARARA